MPTMTPLKQARMAKGMMAKQFAAELGITDRYYSELENGRRPSFWLAKRIAECLGMPLDELFPAFQIGRAHV